MSVRLRITVVATVVNAVVLVVAAVVIVRLVQRDLVDGTERSIDEALEIAREELGGDLAGGVAVDVVTPAGSFIGIFERDGRVLFGIVFEDDFGEPVAEIVLDSESSEVLDVVDPATGGRAEPELTPIEPAEVVEQVELAEAGGDLFGGLGEDSVAEAKASVLAVRNALSLIVPAVVALLGVATWVLVGRALKPVGAITARVRAIGASSLDERVPVPASADEIAELAETMNDMFDRVEAGAERQRNFVSDASHELRSPLSTIKAAAEVAVVDDGAGSRWGALAADVVAEADRMEALVADLLDLARLDDQRRPGTDERVDIAAIVDEAVRRRSGDRVAVETRTVAAVAVVVPGLVERLVDNLVDNAVRHADARVLVGMGRDDHGIWIAVEDDGPGVPTAERERVFERFVRADAPRDRAHGGAGIGLALVRAIATRHGWSVAVDESPDLGGARFRARLHGAPRREENGPERAMMTP